MKGASHSAFRRLQVFGISLTEMILILLFFMFLVAKNALDAEKKGSLFNATCANRLAACELRVTNLEAQISQKDQANRALEKEVAKLKGWVATLMAALGLKPLPVDHPRFTDDAGPKIDKVGGGTGKPKCLPGNSFLLELTMSDGIFVGRRLWETKDDAAVASVPPISQFIEAGQISFDSFKGHAARIAAARPECSFSVRVIDNTTTKAAFKSQLLFLERHFLRRVE